jgi:CRISPR-associated endonuclease Cas2
MAKPPARRFDLREKAALLLRSGFTESAGTGAGVEAEANPMLPLPERIRAILGIIQAAPKKATEMNYIIMYDIEKNKVRNLVAKYLRHQGCIRIQKSVFLMHGSHKKFDEIRETLRDINAVYENSDSIILIPLNVSDARSMKLIGKNVDIERIIDPPGTVFL